MAKNPSGIREFWRKRLVALKRKPSNIALFVMGIAFIYYTFNLTQISNTTALINGPHMGLTGFITILLSTLSLVCFLNSFPHRKKVNIPMLVLMLLMVAAVIYCDYYYGNCITAAIRRLMNIPRWISSGIITSGRQPCLYSLWLESCSITSPLVARTI